MTPDQKESFGEFVRNVFQAASTMALYSKQHRLTVARVSQALIFLNEALMEDETATVMHLGDDLFVNGLPLDKGPQVDRFIQAMAEYDIGHITINREATYDDIELLMLLATHQLEQDFHPTPHLRFGAVEVNTLLQPNAETKGNLSFSTIPAHLIEGLVTTFGVHNHLEQFDLRTVLSVVAGFVTAFRNEANPFLALVPVRRMDEYTFTHSINVCILNLAQGMSLGFDGQILHDIGVAGILHDVGKQFVPEEVLNSPGKLTESEWESMRQHTVRGAEYLLNNPGIPRIAVLTAFEHHMKYDMTGYPRVPQGWQTNLCSQITMISDFFDALRTKRVYRDAMSFDKTAGIMLHLAGNELNPALTLNFLKILRKLEELKPRHDPAGLPPL
jgi:HD-GYP domain-containing protein (c-di-GMP phosphodiesterase class II)